MKKTGENLFVNVFVNVIICLVIISIFSVSLAGEVFTFSTAESDKPIYKGNQQKNNISLMFNVYQGTEYIDGILQTLDKHNAKATFFVGGSWVAKNQSVLQKIVDSKNEVGNHGFLHRNHDKISLEKNKEEIYLCHDMVFKTCGVKMTLFAPPSGAFSSSTLVAAKELGYQTIMWSKDTIDWRDHDKNVIFVRATKNLSNGDLVLMHPTKETLEALDDVLAEIKRQNFEVVVVSDNVK
ncbi:MAG: polysaccharide deacetylase family protein [Clostridia bacterium]|nr:polysaccharide deacetylase family protein [Clostridia bacterium]